MLFRSVEGLDRATPGMRVRTAARGRNYRVEQVEHLGGNRWRLTLDVTTMLGRGRVLSASANAIELDFCIMARTGYLHEAYLRNPAGDSAPIASAYNRDHESTSIQLRTALANVEEGMWLEAVDCVPGDSVRVDVTS